MSYEQVWGVPFSDLRQTGFRPLTDQAWAGVRTRHDMNLAAGRAARMGLRRTILLRRDELKTRYQYTFDLARLRGMRFSFRWSVLAIYNPSIDHNTLSGSHISAWGFFETEEDAVMWKLAVL